MADLSEEWENKRERQSPEGLSDDSLLPDSQSLLQQLLVPTSHCLTQQPRQTLHCCHSTASERERERERERFNTRHDAVLEEIVSLLSAYTEPPAKLSADLDNYSFPHHIVPTDLRPDIVWWNDQLRRIVIVELTISFETSFKQAAERKALKYEDVITRARSVGYSGRVITLHVGSRGIIDQAGFSLLQSEFKIHKRELSHLLAQITSLVLKESYKIWCQRNCQPLS